jgi:hypothetical protein
VAPHGLRGELLLLQMPHERAQAGHESATNGLVRSSACPARWPVVHESKQSVNVGCSPMTSSPRSHSSAP